MPPKSLTTPPKRIPIANWKWPSPPPISSAPPRHTCSPPTGWYSLPTPRPAPSRAEEGEDGSHENHHRSQSLVGQSPVGQSPDARRGVGPGYRRQQFRSEERRVGKEGRSRWAPHH